MSQKILKFIIHNQGDNTCFRCWDATATISGGFFRFKWLKNYKDNLSTRVNQRKWHWWTFHPLKLYDLDVLPSEYRCYVFHPLPPRALIVWRRLFLISIVYFEVILINTKIAIHKDDCGFWLLRLLPIIFYFQTQQGNKYINLTIDAVKERFKVLVSDIY